MILGEPRGGVPVQSQNFAHRDGAARVDAVVAGKAGRLIDDNAGVNRMMVVAGEQRCPGRRAERGGVEPVAAQSHGGDAIERRGRDDAAEGRGSAEAFVVGHDEEDVRRPLGGSTSVVHARVDCASSWGPMCVDVSLNSSLTGRLWMS